MTYDQASWRSLLQGHLQPLSPLSLRSSPLCEGLRGSTKEHQKLDTATQDGQFPRQSIEQIGMCFRTYNDATAIKNSSRYQARLD